MTRLLDTRVNVQVEDPKPVSSKWDAISRAVLDLAGSSSTAPLQMTSLRLLIAISLAHCSLALPELGAHLFNPKPRAPGVPFNALINTRDLLLVTCDSWSCGYGVWLLLRAVPERASRMRNASIIGVTSVGLWVFYRIVCYFGLPGDRP